MSRRTGLFAGLLGAFVLASCSGTNPTMESFMPMKPCPSTPNCVSSDATDPSHAIAPLALAMPATAAWPLVRQIVESMPRTRIADSTDTWIHAEARTRIFRFTDDLELELRAADGVIAVRSASRVGRSDLGVNRRRVERLRALLAERGIVRSASD